MEKPFNQEYALLQEFGDHPKANVYPYEQAGTSRVGRWELYVFNARTGERVVVPTDKWTDQYFSIQGMKLGGAYYYFTRERRSHDEMELCRVDSVGRVEVVISEVCKPYFNVELNASPCWFLRGGEEILWWSERTGFGH